MERELGSNTFPAAGDYKITLRLACREGWTADTTRLLTSIDLNLAVRAANATELDSLQRLQAFQARQRQVRASAEFKPGPPVAWWEYVEQALLAERSPSEYTQDAALSAVQSLLRAEQSARARAILERLVEEDTTRGTRIRALPPLVGLELELGLVERAREHERVLQTLIASSEAPDLVRAIRTAGSGS